jgi:hypothetical protein
VAKLPGKAWEIPMAKIPPKKRKTARKSLKVILWRLRLPRISIGGTGKAGKDKSAK